MHASPTRTRHGAQARLDSQASDRELEYWTLFVRPRVDGESEDKLKRAEVAFNRAMAYRKAGTLTAVHLHLARLYRSWNRPLQEAQVLEWYLRGNPDAGDAEQLRRRIVQLRDGSTGGQP